MKTIPKTLQRDEFMIRPGSPWSRIPFLGASLFVVGFLIVALLGRGEESSHILPYSLLVALGYWTTLGLGALFFVLIHHSAKAGWSTTLRRTAENLATPLPVMAIIAIPVLWMAMKGHAYHWVDPHGDAILEGKVGYLNTGFFWARLVLYLVVWTTIVWLFRSFSVRQDESGDHSLSARMNKYSYPAVIALGLSTHFFAVDWFMSLDAHWYSTIYGVYFFAASVVAAFSMLALLAVLMRRSGAVREDIINVEHLHDIGKLAFAFTVFWTYIAFSQYFIIWYANIPEETLFYQKRWVGSWQGWSVFLVLGHFVIPFFFLMSRHIKRNPITLAIGAGWLLFVHYVDMYWNIMPNVHTDGAHFGPLDVGAWLLIGGVYLVVFGLAMNHDAVVPLKDPRLPESLAYENF